MPLYHCKPVASIVIRVRGIVCVISFIVSFFNQRPCLERYTLCQPVDVGCSPSTKPSTMSKLET